MQCSLVQHSEFRFNKLFTLGYQLTLHAMRRCQQRGITKMGVRYALAYGEQICKQGFTYYYVTKKCLPPSVSKSLKRDITDLVVLVDESESTVLTCYWCYKGLIHLRKKSKVLAAARVA